MRAVSRHRVGDVAVSHYAWILLCELVEMGPMVNHGLISASVLGELRESELSRLLLIDGELVLAVTELGISEYRVLN